MTSRFPQRGNQRVSRLCTVLVSGACVFAAITLVIAACDVITWLEYLYYFSYIKLGVTLIKYIPQVRRASYTSFFVTTMNKVKCYLLYVYKA